MTVENARTKTNYCVPTTCYFILLKCKVVKFCILRAIKENLTSFMFKKLYMYARDSYTSWIDNFAARML